VQHLHGCIMIFHRAFARRRRPRRVLETPRSRLVRAPAVFGLFVLIVGLVLPVASLVLASDAAPFCCARGRCCCSSGAVGDDRTCIRRGCGCDHRDEAVSATTPWTEAVLPRAVTVEAARAAQARWTVPDERPIARADRPAVPPPRRPPLA